MDQKSYSNLGYFRLKQILEIIPISKSVWWDGVSKGKFPQPIKLSSRTTGWKKSDILKLLRDLENANRS